MLYEKKIDIFCRKGRYGNLMLAVGIPTRTMTTVSTIGVFKEWVAEVLELSADSGGQEGKHLEISRVLMKLHKGIEAADLAIGKLNEDNEEMAVENVDLRMLVQTKNSSMESMQQQINALNKTVAVLEKKLKENKTETPIEAAIRAGGKRAEDYITLTKTKKDVLRNMLKSSGRMISGTKDDLINRILEHNIKLD